MGLVIGLMNDAGTETYRPTLASSVVKEKEIIDQRKSPAFGTIPLAPTHTAAQLVRLLRVKEGTKSKHQQAWNRNAHWRRVQCGDDGAP